MEVESKNCFSKKLRELNLTTSDQRQRACLTTKPFPFPVLNNIKQDENNTPDQVNSRIDTAVYEKYSCLIILHSAAPAGQAFPGLNRLTGTLFAITRQTLG